MADIKRFNIQGNKNIMFTIRRIDYIEPKKAITNKALSSENFDLEITNLLDSFTIL